MLKTLKNNNMTAKKPEVPNSSVAIHEQSSLLILIDVLNCQTIIPGSNWLH
jgi:hypothetical protein